MRSKSFLTDLLRAGRFFVFAAMAVCSVTACSSDDDGDGGDGGNGSSSFEVPKYEADAAKYVVNDANENMESIELTASGNYIVTLRDSQAGMPPATVKTPKTITIGGHKVPVPELMKSACVSEVRTRHYSNIAYGKYTKTGPDSYNLAGFGTVTVTRDSQGRAMSLTIAVNGGAPKDVRVTQQNADINSAKSNMLCRTWTLNGYRAIQKINGRTIIDFKGKTLRDIFNQLRDYAKAHDEEFDPSEWVFEESEYDVIGAKQFIFTKTGTYMVLYEDDQLAVSTWKWQNEAAGILRYSWNPNDFYDEWTSGEVYVKFQDNTCLLGDVEIDEVDGFKYEMGLYYIMNEAK